MEDIFSTNSSSVIQKQIEISSNIQHVVKSDADLEKFYDIDKIVQWITKNNFNRVALQFPDELLKDSVKISAKLKEKTTNVSLFILADTSYGSCCSDVVAAQHYNADSMVHFGHSCLSPVDKLPVYFVFEKHSIDLDSLKNELKLLGENNPSAKFIILYDVSYFHLYDEMMGIFGKDTNFYVSEIEIPNCRKSEDSKKVLFSRVLPSDVRNSSDSYNFVYIGSNESSLNQFMFYFNQNKFFKYEPSAGKIQELPFSRNNRELMKRYYLIEKARDCKIFGILVGTMSVSNYLDGIKHVENILKKANRRYYSFLIGKLNCPKLNNFMEVDMYILISCTENSLINSKELNKPIITVYELEIAFNCARLWGEEFVCDFRKLLYGNEHFVDLKLTEKESDVSLITGETRLLRNNEELDTKSDKSLANRDDGLSVIHYSGAGEFLKNRTWTGLEQNLGQTEVTKAIEGRKGIASNYEDEIK